MNPMIKHGLSILALLVLTCSTLAGWKLPAEKLQSSRRTGIPTVPLCDLLRYASRYQNRIVRVRVVYNSWFEGSEFSGAECEHTEGSVWAYFPGSAYSQSKPAVAKSFKDIFSGSQLSEIEKSTRFLVRQTELVVTGKISPSKKKAFGIHGGYAYLFTVRSIEEIGMPHIYDPQSGRKKEEQATDPPKSSTVREFSADGVEKYDPSAALRESLRSPAAGETQALGTLTRIDCDAKGITFTVRIGGRLLKLKTDNFAHVQIITFSEDARGEITCGPRKPENNVVVCYLPATGAVAKINGVIKSLEFVPPDFKLKARP